MNQQQHAGMTGKEALAILHKAHTAVGCHLFKPDVSAEEQAISAQNSQSFSCTGSDVCLERLEAIEIWNEERQQCEQKEVPQ
jgi:hypothetical protein